MADQFDLEQGIMGCWHVTDDLNVLFEELVENDAFTKDQASNFVLGLSTIYEAKFGKLFRNFEEFIREYYNVKKALLRAEQELSVLRDEMEEICEANEALCEAVESPIIFMSLDELFAEEEALALVEEENDRLDRMEDEFGFR